MRIPAALWLALALALPRGGEAQDSLAVLFIGNSLTYVNDLPGLVSGLAAAGGHPLVVDDCAFGGYTLWQHSTNPTTLGRLGARTWDHVVLQEQSQIPVIPWWRDTRMIPAATVLDSLIRRNGSRTLLFMTWGWEEGGQHCIQDSCSIEFRDYQHMQDSLATAYRRLAAQLESGLAPVGEVWSRAVQADPFAPLWAADGYHPALEGSYLAACTFYWTLFAESPVGLTFTAGLDPQRAAWLQQQAADQLPLPPAPARPRAAHLLAAWPNPFNTACQLRFELPAAATLRLEVHDLDGRLRLRRELGWRPAGPGRLRLEAAGWPSGRYLAGLRADGHTLDTLPLMLIK